MWRPTNVDVLEAIGTGYDAAVRCTAHDSRGIKVRDLDLVVTGGSVTMTEGTAPRTCDLTFAPVTGLRDALAPGIEVRPVTTLSWGALGAERIPWGSFVIDEQSVAYDASSGAVSVTGADALGRLVGFPFRSAVAPAGNPVDLALTWARAVLAPYLDGEVVTPRTARVWGQVYEGDRLDAIRGVLRSIGYEMWVDRARRLVVRPIPTLLGAPVWEASALGGSGTLISATSTRGASAVINSYEVRPAVPGWFPRFFVEDTDPRSPTRIDGPLGLRPAPDVFVVESARTADIARLAAETALRRTTGLAFRTSITAAPNPFVEPGDPGLVLLPAHGGDSWVPEKVLVAGVTHSLIPGEAMSLDLRSDRPFVDEAAA